MAQYGENQLNWRQFSDRIRNAENKQDNTPNDGDDVETPRLKRRNPHRQDKFNVGFILNTGNSRSITNTEAEQPTPEAQIFKTPKKAKTRAERRAEDLDEHVNVPTAPTKRVRRSDFWVVQDTLRVNRSRRLKQLETESLGEEFS